jgi:hypothetical protein
MGRRIVVTGTLAIVLIALVFVYLFEFLFSTPQTVAAVVRGNVAHLTLQTVPAYGHAPDPDWVSYLVKDSKGNWVHTTIYQVPAHTLVDVTIYQYDTDSGLRNPFLSQVRGTVGGVAALNGKSYTVVNPDVASHTFTVPGLGISVALPGVGDNAPNQCSVAPCPLSQAHNTITFQFRSPGPGTYRWQCFVPCAFGFLYGNGGPMQTIGWMDGELKVV